MVWRFVTICAMWKCNLQFELCSCEHISRYSLVMMCPGAHIAYIYEQEWSSLKVKKKRYDFISVGVMILIIIGDDPAQASHWVLSTVHIKVAEVMLKQMSLFCTTVLDLIHNVLPNKISRNCIFLYLYYMQLYLVFIFVCILYKM